MAQVWTNVTVMVTRLFIWLAFIVIMMLLLHYYHKSTVSSFITFRFDKSLRNHFGQTALDCIPRNAENAHQVWTVYNDTLGCQAFEWRCFLLFLIPSLIWYRNWSWILSPKPFKLTNGEFSLDKKPAKFFWQPHRTNITWIRLFRPVWTWRVKLRLGVKYELTWWPKWKSPIPRRHWFWSFTWWATELCWTRWSQFTSWSKESSISVSPG